MRISGRSSSGREKSGRMEVHRTERELSELISTAFLSAPQTVWGYNSRLKLARRSDSPSAREWWLYPFNLSWINFLKHSRPCCLRMCGFSRGFVQAYASIEVTKSACASNRLSQLQVGLPDLDAGCRLSQADQAELTPEIKWSSSARSGIIWVSSTYRARIYEERRRFDLETGLDFESGSH
jgi:hypothetical protein